MRCGLKHLLDSGHDLLHVTLIPFGFMSQAPLHAACAVIRSAGTIGKA
jgi:hypothetical protein